MTKCPRCGSITIKYVACELRCVGCGSLQDCSDIQLQQE